MITKDGINNDDNGMDKSALSKAIQNTKLPRTHTAIPSTLLKPTSKPCCIGCGRGFTWNWWKKLCPLCEKPFCSSCLEYRGWDPSRSLFPLRPVCITCNDRQMTTILAFIQHARDILGPASDETNDTTDEVSPSQSLANLSTASVDRLDSAIVEDPQQGKRLSTNEDYLGANVYRSPASTTDKYSEGEPAKVSDLFAGLVLLKPTGCKKFCNACGAMFTFTFRRHRCRLCNGRFCRRCSGKKGWFPSEKTQIQRICDNCHSEMSKAAKMDASDNNSHSLPMSVNGRHVDVGESGCTWKEVVAYSRSSMELTPSQSSFNPSVDQLVPNKPDTNEKNDDSVKLAGSRTYFGR